MTKMINVKIRQVGKASAAGGVHLCDYHADPKAYLATPKLKPGEVISVPEGHRVLDRELAHIVEITNLRATRPLRFEDIHSASAYKLGDEELASEMVAGVQTSLEESQKQRAQNKQDLISAGINPDEVPGAAPFDFAAADRAEGLGKVRTDNALSNDEIAGMASQAAAAEKDSEAPPPSSRRRKKK